MTSGLVSKSSINICPTRTETVAAVSSNQGTVNVLTGARGTLSIKKEQWVRFASSSKAKVAGAFIAYGTGIGEQVKLP